MAKARKKKVSSNFSKFIKWFWILFASGLFLIFLIFLLASWGASSWALLLSPFIHSRAFRLVVSKTDSSCLPCGAEFSSTAHRGWAIIRKRAVTASKSGHVCFKGIAFTRMLSFRQRGTTL